MASKRKRTTARSGSRPWMDIPLPATRLLQVYALDPSHASYCDNQVTLRVPWEPLEPGPSGRKVAVVDYDAANQSYYAPIDLEDPTLLARQGLDPSESDPRFHQQMVYAVASRTIEMFEIALGREIHWRRAERFGGEAAPSGVHPELAKTGDIRVLHLYPHAMHEANAYYSPQARGIVFGYFMADSTSQGRTVPGQRVFTCLSHDIITHEMTHAIIDGIRTHFTEPTNPDVLAFHEGFADLCALFSHFTLKELLVDTIRRTGGRFYRTDIAGAKPVDSGGPAITAEMAQINPLTQLALQFGQASGDKGGLRSALGSPPSPGDINTRLNDAHFRGAILVSAVFDAYSTTYMRKAEVLLEIHRNSTNRVGDDLPLQLSQKLAAIASETASQFFTLCVRSLDYCPPVDITFGDFLRALITVAKDTQPDDDDGVQDALMDAFRVRGIFAESAPFFSEDALAWQRVPTGSLPVLADISIIDPQSKVEAQADLIFGTPNGLTTREKNINGRVLRAWATKHRKALGLDPDVAVTVPSFHSVFRPRPDGRIGVEMIVEIIQSTAVELAPGSAHLGAVPFRGGVTLVIDGPELARDSSGATVSVDPQIRFLIAKPLTPDRLSRQRSFAVSSGLGFGSPDDYQANFQALHEAR